MRDAPKAPTLSCTVSADEKGLLDLDADTTCTIFERLLDPKDGSSCAALHLKDVRAAARRAHAYLFCCKHVYACLEGSWPGGLQEMRLRLSARALPLLEEPSLPLPTACFREQRQCRTQSVLHMRLLVEAEKGLALHCVESCCAAYQRRVCRSALFTKTRARMHTVSSYCQAIACSEDGGTIVAVLRNKERVGRKLRLTPLRIVVFGLVDDGRPQERFDELLLLHAETNFENRVPKIACSRTGRHVAWVVSGVGSAAALEWHSNQVAAYHACTKSGRVQRLFADPYSGGAEHPPLLAVPQELWFDNDEAVYVTWARSALWKGLMSECETYRLSAYALHGVGPAVPGPTPSSGVCIPLAVVQYAIPKAGATRTSTTLASKTWPFTTSGLLVRCCASIDARLVLLLVDGSPSQPRSSDSHICYLFHPSKPISVSQIRLLSNPTVQPSFGGSSDLPSPNDKRAHRVVSVCPTWAATESGRASTLQSLALPHNVHLCPNGTTLTWVRFQKRGPASLGMHTVYEADLSEASDSDRKEIYTLSTKTRVFHMHEGMHLLDDDVVVSLRSSYCGEFVFCFTAQGRILACDRRSRKITAYFTAYYTCRDGPRTAPARHIVWTRRGVLVLPSGATQTKPSQSRGGALMILSP